MFEVSQRTDSLYVLNLINSFFKQGGVYTDIKRVSRYRLRVNKSNISLLLNHFERYPLKGNKAQQYKVHI